MARVIALVGLVMALLLQPNLLLAADQGAGISKYRKFSLEWLLTAEDPSRIKMGAQWFERDGRADQEFADIAARSLWEFSQRTRTLDADTVAWLARALGSTRLQRYKPLLEKLASDNPGKIQNYASESVGKLTTAGAAFDPDSVSRKQIRDALLQDQQSESHADASLFDIPVGIWIEEVFEKLGYPSDINVVSRSRRAPFIGRIYVDNLLLVYGTKGAIEFDYDRGDWYATIVTPRLTLRTDGAAGDDFIQGILSANVALFREAARRASQVGASDGPTLEAAALRLRTDMKTDDDRLADGLAYLCVMIGNAGDVSYHDLLAEVGTQATRTRLRKHAAKALENLSRPNIGSGTRQPSVDQSAP